MGRAVVLGGSVAGLLSARVLAARGAEVLVLERDDAPPWPGDRPGAPQAQHPHALLARGLDALDSLLPGCSDELLAAGAVPIDTSTRFAVWGADARYPPLRGLPPMVGATRGLLEHHLRRRVLASPGVVLERGAVATGLLSAGAQRVAGVRVRRGGQEEEREADLVVDATGRGSRAATWLAELGHRPPAAVVVDPRQGYASRLLAVPPGWEADWTALYVPPLPPTRTRAAVVVPVEGGRWCLGLSGRGDDAPPLDEEGFRRFAAGLGVPEVLRALEAGEPAGPLRGSRSTTNRWYRYDRLRHPPAGLVVVGDAVCAFNPVYAQGMAVAALGALALGAAVDGLRRRAGDGVLASPALPGRAAAGIARVVRTPWLLASRSDARPTTLGARRGRLARLADGYLDRLRESGDEHLALAQARVFHLLAPPSSLLARGVVLRAARSPGR